MLQQKKKICKNCKTEQYIFSKGRCQRCATIEDKKPLKRGSVISKQSEKNKLYRKSQSAIRDTYFEYHIANCRGSEHSGVSILFPTRANCCHLFDKARHPSVQANLINCVYLTLDEHTRFDQLLYSNQFDKLRDEFPNAWASAIGRMILVLPMVKEETKFKNKFEEWIRSKQ